MQRAALHFGLPFILGVLLIWVTGCGSKSEPSGTPNTSGGGGQQPSVHGAMSKVRDRSAREEVELNLKQLAIAIHNAANFTGKLPTQAIVDRVSGKPLLSWRVAILPYLEQNNLHRKFRLNEPWDSPHNKQLISMMPKFFKHPYQSSNDGTTYYQCFMGPNTLLSNRPLTLSRISSSDGTSNTIMLVEGSQAVPWTKPIDVPYDPNKPLIKLGGLYRSTPGFYVIMADGTPRFIRDNVSEQTLRNAITWNDGKPLGSDW